MNTCVTFLLEEIDKIKNGVQLLSKEAVAVAFKVN